MAADIWLSQVKEDQGDSARELQRLKSAKLALKLQRLHIGIPYVSIVATYPFTNQSADPFA